VTLSRKVSNARDTKRPEPPKIKDFATQAAAPLQAPAPLKEPEKPKLPYAHLRVLIVEDNLGKLILHHPWFLVDITDTQK